MISKLMRLYKRSHGLRQICNIAVYIAHSACTIHLLNLPDKNAKRDIVHGVKHLEEIAEGWLGARRSLAIISVLAAKWNVQLPDEAAIVLSRTDDKFGTVLGDIQSPSSQTSVGRHGPTMQPPAKPHVQVREQPGQVLANDLLGVNQPSVAAQHLSQAIPIQSQAGVAAHTNSDAFQPPPLDANSMRARQYPSAATTPATPRVRSWASGNTTRQGASPSDMFGGVEQLIRDSQDWAYRDQAQLATGFENWNQTDMDPATWKTSPDATSGNVSIPAVNGRQQLPNGVALPYAASEGYGLQTTSPQQLQNVNDTSGMATWLNSMTAFNNMAGTYNEDEWYQ